MHCNLCICMHLHAFVYVCMLLHTFTCFCIQLFLLSQRFRAFARRRSHFSSYLRLFRSISSLMNANDNLTIGSSMLGSSPVLAKESMCLVSCPSCASVSCSKIFKYDVYMINESLMMFYSDNDSFFSSFRLSTVAIRILFRWLVSVGAVTFPPREI